MLLNERGAAAGLAPARSGLLAGAAICNWPGHGHEGQQPMLVEITPEKRVVWQFDGRDQFRGIIGLQLLDGVRVRP